jgi:zinc/manganese transport system substrate-binding protein
MLTIVPNKAILVPMTSSPRSFRTRALAVSALATLSAAALVGCSTEDGAATAATQSGEGLTVVASTSIWGDVAEAVLGEDADVSAIVEDSSIDPHSFEPSAADIARAMDADFAVVGGGGYDAWIYEPLGDAATIVHALPLIAHEHGHDHGDEEHDHAEHDHDHAHDEDAHADHDHSTELTSVDGNEHIWYDVDAVTVVAEDIAAQAAELNPETTADASGVVAEMDALRERLAALGEANVAQTETIGDYLIDDSALTDITPASYRQAALNHADPAASDLAEFLEVIESGELDVLIYNPQTATDLATRIREAAEDAGIQVVEIGEVPPEGTDFLDYFHEIVDELEGAVAA